MAGIGINIENDEDHGPLTHWLEDIPTIYTSRPKLNKMKKRDKLKDDVDKITDKVISIFSLEKQEEVAEATMKGFKAEVRGKRMPDPTVIASTGATTKMRIQTFTPENPAIMDTDRLVEMAHELLKGPSEVAEGPVCLEITLFSGTQVDMLIEYLKRLKGDLPIVALGTKVKKDKTIDKMLTDKEPLLDLIKTLKTKGTSQEKLIDMLREYGFKFVSGDVIIDMALNDPDGVALQIQLRSKDLNDKYQFMVRLIKEAKDPLNDKYDFRLVFGIKIVGDKLDKVQVYLWGKYDKTWTIPWEKAKENNFKKVEKVYIFPEFMDYEDRKKWRKEHRAKSRHEMDPAGNPSPFEQSKFYQKYTPYIKGY